MVVFLCGGIYTLWEVEKVVTVERCASCVVDYTMGG